MPDKKDDEKKSNGLLTWIILLGLALIALCIIVAFVMAAWPNGNNGGGRETNRREVTQVTQVIDVTPRFDEVITTLEEDGATDWIRIPGGRRYCVDTWDRDLVRIDHRDRFGVVREYAPGDPAANYDVVSYRVRNISGREMLMETYQVPFSRGCN